MNKIRKYGLATYAGMAIACSSFPASFILLAKESEGAYPTLKEVQNIGIELHSDYHSYYGLDELTRMDPAQRDLLDERGQELVSRRDSLESSEAYRLEKESVENSVVGLVGLFFGGMAIASTAACLGNREMRNIKK